MVSEIGSYRIQEDDFNVLKTVVSPATPVSPQCAFLWCARAAGSPVVTGSLIPLSPRSLNRPLWAASASQGAGSGGHGVPSPPPTLGAHT